MPEEPPKQPHANPQVRCFSRPALRAVQVLRQPHGGQWTHPVRARAQPLRQVSHDLCSAPYRLFPPPHLNVPCRPYFSMTWLSLGSFLSPSPAHHIVRKVHSHRSSMAHPTPSLERRRRVPMKKCSPIWAPCLQEDRRQVVSRHRFHVVMRQRNGRKSMLPFPPRELSCHLPRTVQFPSNLSRPACASTGVHFMTPRIASPFARATHIATTTLERTTRHLLSEHHGTTLVSDATFRLHPPWTRGLLGHDM